MTRKSIRYRTINNDSVPENLFKVNLVVSFQLPAQLVQLKKIGANGQQGAVLPLSF